MLWQMLNMPEHTTRDDALILFYEPDARGAGDGGYGGARRRLDMDDPAVRNAAKRSVLQLAELRAQRLTGAHGGASGGDADGGAAYRRADRPGGSSARGGAAAANSGSRGAAAAGAGAAGDQDGDGAAGLDGGGGSGGGGSDGVPPTSVSIGEDGQPDGLSDVEVYGAGSEDDDVSDAAAAGGGGSDE